VNPLYKSPDADEIENSAWVVRGLHYLPARYKYMGEGLISTICHNLVILGTSSVIMS
jgi:hypothetical protein